MSFRSYMGYSGQLQLHWNSFVSRCVGIRIKHEPVFSEIMVRYGEPNRKYHGIKHPVLLLDEFHALRFDKPEWFLDYRDPTNVAVELAIWDHDLFYDAKAEDNEERSAERAVEHARALGFSDEIGQYAKNYILATKHMVAPTELKAQIVVDIDLSLLADTWENFAQSSKDIRDEYAHVSDEDFVRGRRAFLGKMLGRTHIYSTAHFFEKFEIAARQNLRRSLDEQFAI